jgi:hypothetical protein
MATATARRRGGKADPKPAKPAPEPEVEDIDDLEEDEVEDVEEEPEEEPAPKSRKKKTAESKKKAEVPTNGTQWLADHVNSVLGTEYKAYDLRVVLRKLAQKGKLQREVGADRSRYDFSGPKDPVVLAVIKMLKSGELERDKKAKLDQLKAKKTVSKKPAKPADDEEVGDELDEDVDELDEDE